MLPCHPLTSANILQCKSRMAERSLVSFAGQVFNWKVLGCYYSITTESSVSNFYRDQILQKLMHLPIANLCFHWFSNKNMDINSLTKWNATCYLIPFTFRGELLPKTMVIEKLIINLLRFKFFFCKFMDWDGVKVHKLAKKERGQYPAILTKKAWSIQDFFFFTFGEIFLAGCGG